MRSLAHKQLTISLSVTMTVWRIFSVLATAATVTFAATPAGFQPSSDTDLIVLYGNIAPLNGVVVDRPRKHHHTSNLSK